jgi:transposase
MLAGTARRIFKHGCSGSVNKKPKLTERERLCPCGATPDRDLDAAINIERRGKKDTMFWVRFAQKRRAKMKPLKGTRTQETR